VKYNKKERNDNQRKSKKAVSKCFVSVDFQGFIQALFGELPPQTSEISPISEVRMMTF